MSITSVNPKDLKFIIYARKSTEGGRPTNGLAPRPARYCEANRGEEQL